MKLFISILFLSIGLIVNGQTPCIDGMSGPYPCNEVTMMAHMSIDDLGGATGLNDIWGWTDSLACKEYAIVGKENGTAFVDMTNPLEPCYLGTLPTHTSISTWRDMKVYKDHVFIVSEAPSHGMQVFDLTRLRDVQDPPVMFTTDAHFDGFGNSHNIAINPQTGYAYPIGTSQFSGGPHFVNIQDPTNPVAEGGYAASGYSHDAQIVNYIGPDAEHQGKEIYLGAHGYDGKIVIVDVTDKTDPELISEGFYPNSVYAHQGWITQDHQYFLHNDEIDEGTHGYNTRTRVWDITDLDNPIELPFYDSGIASTDHNHYIKGNYVFQSNYTAGLRILDITDIGTNNIFETAFFDVHPSDNFNGYAGSWSNYPYFASGNVILTHRQGGFFIVRPENQDILDATHPVYSKTCDGTIGNGEAMYTACNPVSTDEFLKAEFQISPNPASDVLSIQAVQGINTVEIIDITGKVVLSQKGTGAANSAFQMDIRALIPGAYLVRINGHLENAQRLIVN